MTDGSEWICDACARANTGTGNSHAACGVENCRCTRCVRLSTSQALPASRAACSGCRYYEPERIYGERQLPVALNEVAGTCHRYAPGRGQASGRFPAVLAADWCAEFVGRERPPPTRVPGSGAPRSSP